MPDAPLIPPGTPLLADRYTLTRRLGMGGMAGVYAAWDAEDQDWKAIKALLPDSARKKSIRKRFRLEAELMGSLSHPNLVAIHEVGPEKPQPWIAMEMVPGGSLDDFLEREGICDPATAVRAVMDACQGCMQIHEQGIVHRDIKPHNILVDAEDRCKLADFGIARLAAGSATQTGIAMGTLGFMAPQQLHDAKSVDHRADIYSLGATLWVMLTKGSVRDLFRIADDPQQLGNVPESLRPVLSRAMQYEPSARQQSIEELIEELEEALTELPTADARRLAGQLDLRTQEPPDSFAELNRLFGIRRVAPIVSDPSLLDAVPPAPYDSGTWSDDGDEDTADIIPDYLKGVKQDLDKRPQKGRYADVVAPPPPTKPAAPTSSRGGQALVFLAAALAGLALVAVTGVGAFAGVGALQAGNALEERDLAAAELVLRVEDNAAVFRELEQLGILPEALQDAREAHDGADPEQRVVTAGALIDLLIPIGRMAANRTEHEAAVVKQRVDRLVVVHDAFRLADATYAATCERTPSRFATALGLAECPAR